MKCKVLYNASDLSSELSTKPDQLLRDMSFESRKYFTKQNVIKLLVMI